MAEFDQNQKVSVEGVVTGVHWTLETGSPNALMLRGWQGETMKPGDHVSVRGYRAKAGSNRAAARSVTLADAGTIFGGQTDHRGPAQ